MNRTRLLWYSILSSIGMLLLVMPAFNAWIGSKTPWLVGMSFFLFSGGIANPERGADPMTLRTFINRLVVGISSLGIGIWLMNTEFAKAHSAGIRQAVMGGLACIWCAYLGYKWGRISTERQ